MALAQEEITEIDREYLSACRRGDLSGVQASVSAGANPYIAGDHLETGLHNAMGSRNLELLTYLVDELGLAKDVMDDMNQTPAHLAAKTNDGLSLKFLDSRGADLTITCNDLSPFDIAEQRGNQDAKAALEEIGITKGSHAARVGGSKAETLALRVIESKPDGAEHSR